MRILFVCHRFPFPPKGGAKIRSFNTITHLSRSHDVTVASLIRSRVEAREAEEIQGLCRRSVVRRIRSGSAAVRMLARLPTRVPSSMGYFYSPALARDIQNLVSSEAFDLIFVHSSSVAQYVEGFREIPKILDFVDMDSQKWLEYSRFKRFPWALGYELEGRKLEASERTLAAKFDMCTVTTRKELEALNSYGVGTRTAWFPNGVNHEYFSPGREPYDADRISFVGRMDYYPNQQCMFDFCANVLPLVQRTRPQATLTIVGANPSRAVRALKRCKGVAVTGTVSDVRPYVRRSAVTVAPLAIARGTQNKVLESLSMRVPVVASPQVTAGVDAISGEHFLLATDPREFASQIVRLLDDPRSREQYAQAGRNRVLTHHSWAGSMERVDEIIREVMTTPQVSKSQAEHAE